MLTGMHELFNSYIANPECSSEDAAVEIIRRTYIQMLGGKDEGDQAELELALNSLISLSRRLSKQPDYVHFIRILMHQPVNFYKDRFTEEESAKFNFTDYNEYASHVIGLLDKCLALADPNPHLKGNEAHLEWLPTS